MSEAWALVLASPAMLLLSAPLLLGACCSKKRVKADDGDGKGSSNSPTGGGEGGPSKDTFSETVKIPTARTRTSEDGQTPQAKAKASPRVEKKKCAAAAAAAHSDRAPSVTDDKTACDEPCVIGMEMDAQLSESGVAGRKVKFSPNKTLPVIPDVSEREAGRKTTPKRAPLTFSRKGRVKMVPMDQDEGWGVDKTRLQSNPERRNHVIRTIDDMGGWLIDKKATEACTEVDADGEKKIIYTWVGPKDPAA